MDLQSRRLSYVQNVFLFNFNDSILIFRTGGDSLYVMLGVPKTATADDIKKTYRKVNWFLIFVIVLLRRIFASLSLACSKISS